MPDGLLKRVETAFQPELFVNHYGSSEIYTFTIEPQARGREFAEDSPLEGKGFEPPVPLATESLPLGGSGIPQEAKSGDKTCYEVLG
jgi:hypothetical protein